MLIAGGYQRYLSPSDSTATAELYDTTLGYFTPTTRLQHARAQHEGTLLPNGKVLITGGHGTQLGPVTQAELYDPATGTFTTTGRLAPGYAYHTATLLANGKVLIVGEGPTDVLLYDPASGIFVPAGTLPGAYHGHTTTLLNDGTVLVAGPTSLRGRYGPANTFTASLSLAQGWLNATSPITISGSTTGAPLDAVALNNGSWIDGDWQPIQSNQPLTTTLVGPPQGRQQIISLHLRDANGVTAQVVTGIADVDTNAPRSGMSPLPTTSPRMFTLDWTGTDGTSGVASYDLDVRVDDGAWTPLLRASTARSTTYTGRDGHAYGFRVRARDVAGNLEPWPTTADTATTVDARPPDAMLSINDGAQATTSPTVTLVLSASDTRSVVTRMRLSDDGSTWGDWQPFVPRPTYALAGGDGVKTVYAQVEDAVGNQTVPLSDTIRLDRAAGTRVSLAIEDGAQWTTSPTVTLRIGAPGATAAMQISLSPEFDGADWQPFDTRATTTISTTLYPTFPRTVYLRTRGLDGTLSARVEDSIFYDPDAPLGSVTILRVDAATLDTSLAASDPYDVSGVARMRVGLDATFAGAPWEPFAPHKTLEHGGVPQHELRVYAQFEDGAGNQSAISCARPNGRPCQAVDALVYLPLVWRYSGIQRPGARSQYHSDCTDAGAVEIDGWGERTSKLSLRMQRRSDYRLIAQARIS